MMWPPHSVKILSTPSFLSALATSRPPEITWPALFFCFSVSSAVVVTAAICRISYEVWCWQSTSSRLSLFPDEVYDILYIRVKEKNFAKPEAAERWTPTLLTRPDPPRLQEKNRV